MNPASTTRQVAQTLVPFSWRRRLRSTFGWRWFRGNFATWTEARQAAVGYDDERIVAHVLQATLKVRSGAAAFERDGVTFAVPEPDAPLLTALQRVHAESGGRLRVLDFGGALGSSYWRHRAFLDAVPDLRWDIVEQPLFVEAGRSHLADTRLRFFSSVDEALATRDYDVLLASTVVQYLEQPTTVVAAWTRYSVRWLLLNNVPLHSGAPDRLAVQHVPPSIYPASYPVWFFNREKFLAQFGNTFDLIDTFPTEAVWPLGWRLYPSTGLLLRRRSSA